MFELAEPFILAFIQIFVAVDVIGTIPLFVSLAEGTTRKQKSRIIRDSVTTATLVALIFMLVGKLILRAIGITIPDFQIAGGLLLFFISVRLILPGSQKHFLSEGNNRDVAVFPLATPLITGPAVLTTTLIMLDTFGLWPTFLALALNMIIVWVTLAKSDRLILVFGINGTRAFSKIMYILLAAIGVMMIRKGVMGMLP